MNTYSLKALIYEAIKTSSYNIFNLDAHLALSSYNTLYLNIYLSTSADNIAILFSFIILCESNYSNAFYY